MSDKCKKCKKENCELISDLNSVDWYCEDCYNKIHKKSKELKEDDGRKNPKHPWRHKIAKNKMK